jgi:polar amino acid transport system substrate-binding protein
VRKMNNIKRKISISFIIYMFIAVLCGCRDNQYDVNANEGVQLKEIIIGSDIQPPFNYVDSDGNPTGIDVELATEAFRRMGYKAVFVNINWDDKQELLSSHTIDCVWGSFSMNGREDKYRWAGPYMKSRIVIAVNKDSNIYTIEDLWDKTVAVQAASKPEEMFLNMADSKIPRIRSLLSMKNRELTYPMLSKGYADALAVNEIIINQYMKDYNMQFRILEESLDTVGLGVAFDKNDTRGIDRRLTDILINMHDDGTEKEILEKYVEDTDKYLEVGVYE